MKLYTTGRGHWGGTQTDAKKLKKQHGTPCELYEVPVSKEDLLAFLNRNTVITDVAQAVAQPAAPHDVPKRAVVDDVTERSFASLEFIGKTTILVGGFLHKLHCYYYTDQGGAEG